MLKYSDDLERVSIVTISFVYDSTILRYRISDLYLFHVYRPSRIALTKSVWLVVEFMSRDWNRWKSWFKKPRIELLIGVPVCQEVKYGTNQRLYEGLDSGKTDLFYAKGKRNSCGFLWQKHRLNVRRFWWICERRDTPEVTTKDVIGCSVGCGERYGENGGIGARIVESTKNERDSES